MQKTNKLRKKQTIAIVAGFIVALVPMVLFFMYDLYVGGGSYRQAKRDCGSDQLVYARSNPKDPRMRYVRPSDPNYSVPWPNAEYFCTEQDAIDAGYTPLYDDEGYYNE